jgi:hypothetical protein
MCCYGCIRWLVHTVHSWTIELPWVTLLPNAAVSIWCVNTLWLLKDNKLVWFLKDWEVAFEPDQASHGNWITRIPWSFDQKNNYRRKLSVFHYLAKDVREHYMRN